MSFYANNELARTKAKKRARTLQTQARERGDTLGYQEALELVAREMGFRDWNTASALVSNYPDISLQLGDHVRGTYLKQPFTARIVSISKLGNAGHHQLALQLDEPVDVVSFNSFSAWRHHVKGTVDEAGRAISKTSDGEPHLEILGHVHA